MNAQLARKQDGTLTKRALASEIARVTAELEAARAEVKSFETAYGMEPATEIPETVADAWNAAHDTVRALESELREIEQNRAPITVGSTAWLAANNID